MKKLFVRNKKTNCDKNRSQKSTVLYDNQKVYNKIDTMSRNISRIQLHHKTLQRKEQCMSRCVKLIIRFNTKRKKIRNSTIKNKQQRRSWIQHQKYKNQNDNHKRNKNYDRNQKNTIWRQISAKMKTKVRKTFSNNKRKKNLIIHESYICFMKMQKKNYKQSTQQINDKTFQNWENTWKNYLKLLFFSHTSRNHQIHLTM